ncbi:MAG TPA: hypothetical protein VFG38_17735 [Pseudomonadales bacterium]|nr:hypothetical protein [Pseudomonadales bacterium]
MPTRICCAVLLLAPALAFAADAPATLACQTDYNTSTHGHRVHTRYVSALFSSEQDPAQLVQRYGLNEPFGATCAPLTTQKLEAMTKQVEHSNGVVVQVDWQP